MNPPADTLSVSAGGFLHLYSSQTLENERQSNYTNLLRPKNKGINLTDSCAERQTQQVGHERRTVANQNLTDTALERGRTREQTHHAAGEA